jgi:hypothetical protein
MRRRINVVGKIFCMPDVLMNDSCLDLAKCNKTKRIFDSTSADVENLPCTAFKTSCGYKRPVENEPINYVRIIGRNENGRSYADLLQHDLIMIFAASLFPN